MFQKKIATYISRKSLLKKGAHCLVALSGGADSVALLRVLIALGYRVSAAHCNFQLRGEESIRDEQFCRALCERLQVPLQVRAFDTQRYAAENKVSIEMAARELRYAWFSELVEGTGAEVGDKAGAMDGTMVLCVAHHMNDNAETLLLNLLRGTGLDGLCAIRPKTAVCVRPLLGVTRQEIETYLSMLQQDYITDSTNLIADVQRNQLRLNVLPLLQQINPRAMENIALLAERLSDEQELLLWQILRDRGFTPTQVQQLRDGLLTAQTGTVINSPTHRLLIDRQTLVVEAQTIPSAVDAHTCTVDASTITPPLTIRPTAPGDSFTPFGMRGTKLVSDYLTDRKVNCFDKSRQQVVADATGKIVWLVGHTINHHCRLTPESREAIIITTEPSPAQALITTEPSQTQFDNE